MYLFTFDYHRQWTDGFYQVMSDGILEAREIMKKNNCPDDAEFVNCFKLDNDFRNEDEYLYYKDNMVYSYEIENPNYEG